MGDSVAFRSFSGQVVVQRFISYQVISQIDWYLWLNASYLRKAALHLMLLIEGGVDYNQVLLWINCVNVSFPVTISADCF